MSFLDKSLTCSDCGTTFTFSSGEQEFFQSKGFTNEPKRCPSCAEPTKHGVPRVAVTATRHGIKSSVYLSQFST